MQHPAHRLRGLHGEGAVGHLEGETQRMVTTPWLITRSPCRRRRRSAPGRFIAEHSTIGIVITTDGTITEIPREDYLEAEDRVITELKELGKPFWSSSTPPIPTRSGPRPSKRTSASGTGWPAGHSTAWS